MLATSLHTKSGRSRPRSSHPLLAWIPQSWPQRLFILITLTEACTNVSIEAVLLSRYNSSQGTSLGSDTLRALPVFVLCFCMAHTYQVILTIDACVNRNMIMVVGLGAFNAAFLVYSVSSREVPRGPAVVAAASSSRMSPPPLLPVLQLIQIGEVRQVLGDGVQEGSGQHVPVQILTGAIPVVIGVAQLAYMVLGWSLWKEFGWQIYKSIIGADRMLKKALMQYQVYVVLLKFDFFVFLAFCLQLVLIVLTSDIVEKVLTMVAAPLVLFLLIFAWWSVRREKKWGMIVFMMGLLGAAFYFSWKLWRIWSQKDGLYAEVYKSLTVFCVLALALDVSTMILGIRCLTNFGRGLCQAMDRAKNERKAATAVGMHPSGFGGSGKDLLPLSSNSTLHLPAQPRISLD